MTGFLIAQLNLQFLVGREYDSVELVSGIAKLKNTLVLSLEVEIFVSRYLIYPGIDALLDIVENLQNI